jgi:putative transposase
MKYNPEIHHRHSLRLGNYDYSKNGNYFVTIVVKNRLLLFGNVINGTMNLNDAGKMIDNVWNNLPGYIHGIEIDCGIVMPNHFHGIIILNHKQIDQRLSLPEVMERFKSFTTHEYIDGVRNFNWEPFQAKLWQRNYFDSIISDKKELNSLRKYIKENPEKWDQDEENPIVVQSKCIGNSEL